MAEPYNMKSPRLSIGSWHIFSRLSFNEGAELVKAAIDRGINEFDIGDYWDHALENTTRFRDIVRHLGLPRESYKLSIKLFTNTAQTREEVLRAYMDRLGVETVDYAICSRPAQTETLDAAAEAMAGLVKKGLTKALAVSLWDAPLLGQLYQLMKEKAYGPPEFVQFQYNICRRDVMESEAYRDLFARTTLKLQAAFTLEGGILAGHVNRRRFGPEDRAKGEWFPANERNIARDSGGIRDKIKAVVPKLAQAAKSLGVSAAQLAMAFTATHPAIHSVLFGATRIWQLDEALAALELAKNKPGEVRELVSDFYMSGAEPPALFDFSAGVH